MAISYEEYRKKYNDNLNEYQNNARKQTVNTNTVKTTNSNVTSTPTKTTIPTVSQIRRKQNNEKIQSLLEERQRAISLPTLQPKTVFDIVNKTDPNTGLGKINNEINALKNYSKNDEIQKLVTENYNLRKEEKLNDPNGLIKRGKGNIFQNVLGTIGDVGLNVIEGVSNIGDQAARLVTRGVSDIADTFGNKKLANKLNKNLETKKNPVGQLLNKGEEAIDKYSYSGNLGDKVANAVGYSAGMWAGGQALAGLTGTGTLGKVGVDATGKIVSGTGIAANGGNIGIAVGGHVLNMPTLAIISGASGGLDKAYSKGASKAKAWEKALGSGVLEGVTEGLFGLFGVGGSSLDDALVSAAKKRFGEGVGEVLGKFGIAPVGESLEELLSYAGNQGLDYLLDKANKDGSKFYEKWDWNEVGQEMAIAFLSTALSQGGSTIVNLNNQKIRDSIIDNAEEQLGRKLTTQEKESIINQIEQQEEAAETTNNEPVTTPTIENTDTLSRLQQVRQQQEQTKASLLNQQQQQRQQQMLEETNNRVAAMEKQLEQQETRITEETEKQKEAIIENFKQYLEKNNITNPTQKDIDNAITENLIYNNDLDIPNPKTMENLYNKYVKEYIQKNNTPFNNEKSLKEQQNEIIQKSNPKNKDLGEHTWINNVEDIKTFKEALDYDEYEGNSLAPDFTDKMVDDALKTGKMTVYSSYPIEQGTFVSPSKMEAQSYAGNGKVYSKEVALNDIAWIDSLQGQYAKVPSIPTAQDFNKENLPKQNKGNIPIQEDLYQKYPSYKDIFNGERNNYDGNIEVNTDITDILNNYNLNDMKSSKEAAIKVFETFHNNNLFTNDGNKIEVSKDGIRESIQKIFENEEQKNLIKEHMQVFSDLGDIIEHADLVGQANNNKPGERPDVNSWNYYFDGLNINDKKYSLEFEVRSMNNGNNQYRVQRLEPKVKTTNSSGVASNNTRNLPPNESVVSINNNTINKEKSQVTLPSKTTEEKVQEKVTKTKENKGIEALRKAANMGKSYLQLKQSEVKQLKEDLREFTGKTKEELTNAKTYNKIKDTVEQFMTREIEHLDYDIKQVKNQIRDTKIKVNDSLKNQITDYSDFRKANFGKLKLGDTGQSVDSIYQELSGMYPYYFNPEIDTEADMLYEISDFMNKSDKTIEKYDLSDSELKRATDKIFNSLINNSLSNEDIETIQNELMERYSRRTRKVVQEELLEDMGITEDDISVGKDISALDFQRTDPIRLNEKVFGDEIGKKINDATINKTKHNEAERTRFLNKERDEIRELGIKPRSKESAAVQKYGEKQYLNDNNELVPYGDRELARDFPNVDTQNKIKHAAEVLRGKYDRYIDDINAVITNMGYDAIPKRPDYMRHFQEINDKLSQWGVPLNPTSMNENNIPTDINGLTDQFKPGKNWFASAMQRKGLKTTYDAITGIDGYLEGASNLIYHTEDIQRYRALSKLVRDTYGQTHGMDNIDPSTEEGQKRLQDIFDNKLSKYAAWLDEQANALAGKKGGIDRAAERLLGRKIYSILDAAKKQVGSNMTGFNVRSAMTNFASAVQGVSKTNKLAFLKGTISTMQNIIHDDGLINKSDFLTSRFGSDQLSKKLWQKASNAGQIFMTGTDYFTANQIWRGKYYENLSKGMNEKQAIKQADDFAARIMGDRSKGSTAEVFNSKTLGLLTQFQLEVNNQWSSIMHDNKMDIKTGNKSGATVMFQLGQLAALSYMFNGLMKSLTGSDVMIDPIDMLKKIIGGDDDDDKTAEERAREVMGDLINDVPFVSFMTGGRIPMSEAFKGAETGLKYLTGQKDKYNNDIKIDDVKKDLIESAYYWLLPTGYGQIKKTTKGASMYDKKLPVSGSYTASGNLRFTADESTGGKAKALLFGQYTSKEAQKYIESGYKSISKSRLDEIKELGMSASQYRKYREGLNSAGTTNADKIDYIANSKYSDSQKDIMAKNVLGKDFDIDEYKKYGSYEEYDYATKYPEKYSVNTQIAPYDKYTKYKEEITNIRNNTKNDKEETINYINSLNMSVPQKAMFIKQYYKSFKQYDGEIVNYINSQKLTTKEKTQVLEQLGFTVKDGRVYY